MKSMTLALFALLIIIVFPFQESRASGRPKMNELFRSGKFSKSILMRGNEFNDSETFYSIKAINNNFLTFNFSSEEGNQFENLKTKKASKKLKWLGLGAFWWAAFFDHYQDALDDRKGKKDFLFGADRDQWHLAKNLAHIGYLTSALTMGMELERGNPNTRSLVYRTAGGVLIYWFIQEIVYDKAIYDVWFDYKNEYREHGPIVFDLKGKDHRIKIAPWARPFVDIIKVGGGLYLAIKF